MTTKPKTAEEIERILIKAGKSYDLTKEVFQIEQIIKRVADEQVKAKTLEMQKEIEELKANSCNRIAYEFLVREVADRDLKISRIEKANKAYCDEYDAIKEKLFEQTKELDKFFVERNSLLKANAALESQLSNQSKMLKDMAEALEEALKYLPYNKEIRAPFETALLNYKQYISK